MSYPDSWYVATAKGIQDRPALEENLAADVCVIGGGFTGLSAALNLAELGKKVVLLEAERVRAVLPFEAANGEVAAGHVLKVLDEEHVDGGAPERPHHRHALSLPKGSRSHDYPDPPPNHDRHRRPPHR